MHTLHWFAVEAENEQEAFESVKDRLINDDGSNWVEWSDWHVVGGGRWNDNGSPYEDQNNMVVSYAKDPDKFNETLQSCRKARIEEMNRYITTLDYDKLVSDMVDYVSNNAVPNEERFNMNSYYFKKAGEMLSDHYGPDSYFYDLKEFTAHMGYIQERLDNTSTGLLQYLVPVDFHF